VKIKSHTTWAALPKDCSSSWWMPCGAVSDDVAQGWAQLGLPEEIRSADIPSWPRLGDPAILGAVKR